MAISSANQGSLDLSDRRQRIKHKMEQARTELVELLLSLTPEQMKLPTRDEGWSVFDVAAHIAGAEAGMEVIGRRILAREPSMVPNFDIERFNAGGIKKRQGKTMQDFVDELKKSREKINALLDSATDEQLDYEGEHPTVGKTTFYGLLVVIYRHERIHTEDIKAALQQSNSSI